MSTAISVFDTGCASRASRRVLTAAPKLHWHGPHYKAAVKFGAPVPDYENGG